MSVSKKRAPWVYNNKNCYFRTCDKNIIPGLRTEDLYSEGEEEDEEEEKEEEDEDEDQEAEQELDSNQVQNSLKFPDFC